MDTEKLCDLLYGYSGGEVSWQELKAAIQEFLKEEQALYDPQDEEE